MAGEIRLDYAIPAVDVAEHVTLFYYFWADVPVFEDMERADNAQLRFRLSGHDATYCFPGGIEQEIPEVHVVGPTSTAFLARSHGPVAVFGMGVTAAGWAAMIGADASTMLNRVIDATGLFGAARLKAVAEALQTAEGIEACAAIGEALVRDLVSSGDTRSTEFVRQVDAWLAASPSPQIDVLTASTGLSRRQVERKCNVLYGAPPKLLARKYRALRAAVAMAGGEETRDDAIDRGFYDQSHMIREIKQFVGLTPGQIRAEPTVLSRLTMLQRRGLGDKVGPLISGT